MQNVMSMPSAAGVNVQGLGKQLAVNKNSFVVNLLVVSFCGLFSAILWVKLNFIGITWVRGVNKGIILGHIQYQSGYKAVMFLK